MNYYQKTCELLDVNLRSVLPLILFFSTLNDICSQIDDRSDMLTINNVELFFQKTGEGPPLLLLHGWTQSSAFWKELIPIYAKQFTVYALDLHGHGRSSNLNSDFTIKKTAQDVKTFMDELGIQKANAIGMSFGGLVLLELSVMYPEQLKSMVVIGSTHDFDGSKNNESKSFSYDDLPNSFIADLKRMHPRGEDQIRHLFDPNIEYKIQLTPQEVKNIEIRTLIVNGDRDEILGVQSAFDLYEYLPLAQLWIMPNTGHVAVTDDNRHAFISATLKFFEE